jgi:hypothetical protein
MGLEDGRHIPNAGTDNYPQCHLHHSRKPQMVYPEVSHLAVPIVVLILVVAFLVIVVLTLF